MITVNNEIIPPKKAIFFLYYRHEIVANNFDNSINPNSAISILINKMEEKRKENQNNLNNKITTLQKIKHISLIDNINEDYKKNFDNNELSYYEIIIIDGKINNFNKSIKDFPIIDEIDEIKKIKNNIQNIVEEIKNKHIGNE